MSKVLLTYRYRDPVELPEASIVYGKLSPRSVGDVDAIVTLLTDRVDAKILSAAARLKIVANVAMGHENIDLAAACARGVVVTNVPGVTTQATADLAWGLILSVARRIVEGDRFVRQGRFRKWDFHTLCGMELAGKTLGIVGPGRIGMAVAERAVGFGLHVLFAGKPRKELEQALRESDIVTLHCPLNAQTRGLIGPNELALMKPTALLVNTSRGPIVNEAALAKALRERRLGGAGLDVYENEPEVHPALLRQPNTVLVPHIGSATRETRGRMLATALHNVAEALAGRVPPNLVREA